MNIHDIEPMNLLAGSITSDGNVVDTSNPVIGDAGDAAARELFEDDSIDLSKFMWTILFLLFSITVGAQTYTPAEPADAPADGKTHGMTLYLKNDTQVTYELQELSHVTYLPGVGMKVYLKNATTSVDYLFQQMNKIDYATNDDYTALHCDTMYIVKAATITNKVNINGTEVDGIYPERCIGNDNHTHELIVPKNQPVKNLADYAISIQELQERTGIDFFCNLPDWIEETVEAQEPDLTFWKKITRTE